MHSFFSLGVVVDQRYRFFGRAGVFSLTKASANVLAAARRADEISFQMRAFDERRDELI